MGETSPTPTGANSQKHLYQPSVRLTLSGQFLEHGYSVSSFCRRNYCSPERLKTTDSLYCTIS